MITFERPKERVVGIGEHIEGIGVVLDPDDFPVNYAEAIHRQTAQIDESIREMNSKIAAGYLSNLCEYSAFNNIDFEHDDIHCTVDFDGLRKKAGMEVDA